MNSIWQKLKKKSYRAAYTSAKIDSDLAAQIYALRDHRGWTQADLANQADMAQPRIAKLESSCDGVTTATLKRIAAAFDVSLEIRFVPFSQSVAESVQNRIDRPIPAFESDISPTARNNLSFPVTSNTNPSLSVDVAPVSRLNFQRDWFASAPISNPTTFRELTYANH